MAVSSDYVEDEDLDGLDGKGMRNRLESALREKRALEAEVVALKAKDVIASKGYDLVTAEDLKGVKADDLESAAERIQGQKLEAARSVVRTTFAKQGYEGDDLEDAVKAFFGEGAGATQEDDKDFGALSRAHRVPAGDPAPRINPDKLTGEDAIAAGLESLEAKRNRTRR